MSVTAVPLRPLDKGTVPKLWIGILLVVLLGAGLAWLGTSKLQYSVTDSKVRYRIMTEGQGDKAMPDDLIQLEFEIRRADGTLLDSTARTGQPLPATANSPFPGLREVLLELRSGSIAQAFVSAEQAIGQPVPPGGPVPGNEVLEFRLRAGSILKGMGAMQQMMGPGAGPGGAEGQMGPPPGGPAEAGPAGPGGPGGR